MTGAFPELYGLLAEFHEPEAVVAATHATRVAGYRRLDAYSPFPVHGLAEALSLDPSNVVGLLNELFSVLTEIVFRHGGTVDKFIGDAVMAFWNAPVEQSDHAARACRATQDLLRALVRLNVGWAARGSWQRGLSRELRGGAVAPEPGAAG